jgi:CheY-like chemotaxis protein
VSASTSRPTIRCFPSSDRAFAAAVARTAEGIDAAAAGAAEELELVLRRRYPSARVSAQDPLATFGGKSLVWYVYRRDGPTGVGPSSAAAAADGPGLSRTARPVYSPGAVATMIGVPLSILVGWDEQDGYVRPTAATSGVRLYSRDDLEDLLVVKRLTTRGSSADAIRSALDADRAKRAAGPSGTGAAGHRMLVLLAERDPYAAEMAEYFLRTEGYEVEVSYSLADAEAIALDRTPQLAVVELLLSGGAGAELCARLKSQADCKVVAISTLDFEATALQSGADAFLRKPLDPLELVSTIRDLLGESALLRREVEV